MKHFLIAALMVVGSMIAAVLMSFVYSWLCRLHPGSVGRFDLIFGLGGSIIGLLTLINICFYLDKKLSN